MTSEQQLSPIPIDIRLKAIEVLDIDKLKNKKSYFAIASVDGNVALESEKKTKYKKDPLLRWEWPEECKFGVHPSSTIAIKIYRSSGLPLSKPHFVGEHSTKLIELVGQNDASFNLKNEKGAVIKIRIILSLVPAPAEDLDAFMESVEANISRLDGTGKMSAGISIIGSALQFTKNIMHIVADAHPILKVSWTFLSVVYDAIEMVELQDGSVRELAEGLKELLALANQRQNLPVIKGTDNVTDEIGRLSLRASSLIYEYAKPKFTGRAINLQLSDDLKKRIIDCQKSCIELQKKFDRRILIGIDECAQDIKDINAKMRNTLETVKDDHLADKIWQWLSAPDSSPNYHAAVEKHQAGTFNWFLDGDWFRKLRTEAGVLWIKGTAGCGKTVLCSSIIKNIIHFVEKKSHSSSEAYAYFFFDGRDSQRDLQFHGKLIRSLIRQLSTHFDGIPAALAKLYRAEGHQQPSISLLQDTLHTIIQGFDSVYIVIDSLDECVERERTLLWIQGIISHGISKKLHMVVASRPEHDISVALRSLNIPTMNVLEEIGDDIANYLDAKLQFQTKWDDETRAKVKSSLKEGAEGMFQWVALQLIELQKCSNKSAVLKQLQRLPKGLFGTYDQILSKIDKETDSMDVKTFLRMMSFSIRPLSLSEIAAAAVVEFDENNEPRYAPLHQYWDEDDVLRKCSGLITQSDNSTIIKLSHFSVKEYLLSDHLNSGPISSFHLSSANLAHTIISQTCLTYLLHFDIPESLGKNFLKAFPLAKYAAQYWFSHIHCADIDTTQTSLTWSLAYKLFDPSGATWTNWVRIWNVEDTRSGINATPLYYASVAGIAPVVRYLLENGADVNSVGGECGTALQGAAYRGHAEVVEVLLANGAVANLVGGRYGNALQAASYQGETEVVELLLANGANIDLAGGEYGSALQAAAIAESYTIIELLLESGANVNLVGGKYGSALQAASCLGHTEIAKLLLARGADVNLVGGQYGTALQAASIRCIYANIELLLENSADVNLVGGKYGTALQAASLGHQCAIVKLLLDNGADVNIVRGQYGTALQAAVIEGDYAVIELLLKTGADINLVGGEFVSALRAALWIGDKNIVELLLKNGADINIEGGNYGGPLHDAIYLGHSEIVELLVQNGADVNAIGKNGSALQAASRWGHTNIVDLLLKRGADASLVGENDSPLQAESPKTSEEIVESMRERGVKVYVEREGRMTSY